MSYFESTNTNKDRALNKIKGEVLIIQKFRKVILLDDSKANQHAHEPNTAQLDYLLASNKNVRPRGLNDIVVDFMQDKNLTPSLIACALGFKPYEVEKILQGNERHIDMVKVDLIAQLLGVSTGELIDLTRMRRSMPKGHFIRSEGITQSARVFIDRVMQGKRLKWWDDLKSYLYDRNAPKGHKTGSKEAI